MQQTHFLQKLYNRYYPQKSNNLRFLIEKDLENLTENEKEKLSEKYLQEGEILLAKKDTSAIEYFNAAAQLSPLSSNVWLRQGNAFFSYGKLKNQEKALFLANKNYKMAASINETFEIYWQWAKTLAFLGKKTEENHYFHTAKEKYQKALDLAKDQSKETLAVLHWEFANLWMTIAQNSEEAGDVRIAIQFYRMSFALQTKIEPLFWCDFGNAYLQMGLFINDNRLYFEAVDYFTKALRISKDCSEAFFSIAHAYTELYINTLDERCFKKAHEAFLEYLKLNPNDADAMLELAQLLGESGKNNKDKKKLKLSIEACINANRLDKKNTFIIGQWVESLSLYGACINSLELIQEAENKIADITEKNPKIADLWYSYGVCLSAFSIYYNDLDYDEIAIEKFQTGLTLDRSNSELWHALALTHAKIGNEFEDLDYLQKAAKFYLRAIDLKPSCPSLTSDYGKLLLKIGEINSDQKVLEEALFYLESTLNNQNDAIMQHPDWLFSYGRVLDLLGDCLDDENSSYKKALKAFHNVLLIDPDYPRIHYHIGICYSHLGEITLDPQFLKQAIGCFKLALKQNEEDDLVYLEWGLTLISLAEQMSELNQAQKECFLEAEQKILKSGQLGNLHAYYHLACLYSLLNKLEESMHFLEKAHQMEILPTIDEVLQDDWLDNVRSTKAFQDFIAKIEKQEKFC